MTSAKEDPVEHLDIPAGGKQTEWPTFCATPVSEETREVLREILA